MFCQVLQLEHVPIVLQELHGGVIGGHCEEDLGYRLLVANDKSRCSQILLNL
jgi:hypothetical protein